MEPIFNNYWSNKAMPKSIKDIQSNVHGRLEHASRFHMDLSISVCSISNTSGIGSVAGGTNGASPMLDH
jgi:hypothetical protein